MVWACMEGKTIRCGVLDGRVLGKIPISRPRTRWKDVVKRDIIMIHESIRRLE